MTRVFVRRGSDSLTCPLQVTDDHFVAQIARVVAPFVSQLRPLHSDWCNSRLLALIDRAEPFHSYIQCWSLKDIVCTRAITASDFSIRKEFTLKIFIGTGLKNKVSDGLNPCLLASSLLLHFLCRWISTLALFFFFSATNCQLLKLCQSGGRMWITQVHVTLSLQNTNTTETHL